MGLSNEERQQKLIYTVNAMTKEGRKLDKSRSPELTALVEGLWHALLGSSSNSSYWILGGDMQKDTVSLGTLFGCLLRSSKHEKDAIEEMDEKRTDELRKSGKSDPQFEYSKYHGEFLRTADYYLAERGETHLASCYKLLDLCDSAIYALRRYDDEMSRSLESLSSLISKIQGECFSVMEGNDQVLHAWLYEQISAKILTYNHNDPVNQWWKSQNLHHDFRMIEWKYQPTTERLVEMYGTIQFKDIPYEPSLLNERLAISLEIMGARYHYDHQHKAARLKFVEWNKTCPEGQEIDLSIFDQGVKKCSEAYIIRTAESAESYKDGQHCDLTGRSPFYEKLDREYAERNKPVKPKKTKKTK